MKKMIIIVSAIFTFTVATVAEPVVHAKNSVFSIPSTTSKRVKRSNEGGRVLLRNSANIDFVRLPEDPSTIEFYEKWDRLPEPLDGKEYVGRCSKTQDRLVDYYNYAINSTDNNDFDFAVSQVDAYLTFVKHRILLRRDQHFDIDGFPTIYNITFPPKFDVVCVSTVMALRRLQFQKIGSLEEYQRSMSDITNGIHPTSGLHRYASARNRFHTAVMTLRRVSASETEKTAFINICNRLVPFKFYAPFIINDGSLAKILSFSQLKLNAFFKIVIADIILHEIVTQGCRALGYVMTIESFDATAWQSIHSYFKHESEYLQANWHKEQLRKDVQDRIGGYDHEKDDGRGINNDTMSAELEEKYYWATFRAHTYHTRNEHCWWLTPNIQKDQGHSCVKKRHVYVAVWWKNIDQTTEPEQQLKSNIFDTSFATTQQPITLATSEPRPVKMVQANAVTANLDKLILPITEVTKSKVVVTVGENGLAAAKCASALIKIGGEFKKVMKGLSAIGKYLGPMAGALTYILWIFLEDGTANVMDRLNAGFNEMHYRFDLLQAQLSNMHKELISKMEEVAEFNTAYQNYQLKVQYSLVEINKTFANFDKTYKDGMSGHSDVNIEAVYTLLKLCKHGEKSPFSVLQSMSHFMTDRGYMNLGDKLIKYTLEDRMNLHLLLMARASELAQLVVFNARCSFYRSEYMEEYIEAHPISNVKLTTRVDNEITAIEHEMAEGFEISRDITAAILKLDRRHLYSWQKVLPKHVNDFFKNEKDVTAQKLRDSLENTFKWNTFAVTIVAAYWGDVTVSGSSENIFQIFFWTNPDYSLVYVKDGNANNGNDKVPEHWTRYVIINWLLNAEKMPEIRIPKVDDLEAWHSYNKDWTMNCLYTDRENIKSFFKCRSFDHVFEESYNWVDQRYNPVPWSHKQSVDNSSLTEGFPMVHGQHPFTYRHSKRGDCVFDTVGVCMWTRYRDHTLNTHCMAFAGYGY